MKMICLQAKTTVKRDKAIEGVIAKHPELQSKSLGTWGLNGVTRSYINWMTEDDQTIIQNGRSDCILTLQIFRNASSKQLRPC
jgi:hypothetical protein